MRYVYLVRTQNEQYKVGIASNVEKRIKSLQTSNPDKIELVTAKATPDAHVIEKSIHLMLQEHRLTGGREWFFLPANKVIDVCVLINSSPGLTITEIEYLEVLVLEQQSLMQEHESKTQEMLSKANNILEQAKLQVKPKALKVQLKQLQMSPKLDREATEKEMFERVLEIIQESGKASTSMLQRKLRIGYGRAARIMEKLEEQGYISELDGSRARSILLTSIDKETEIAKSILNV
jgi:DNA segregation ATPase FtsK/SpoIIIE-like protein